MNSGSCGYLDKSPRIGQYQGSATAQDDYDTAIAAAEAAYGLGLAGANLTWTTDVVGAETTFLCDEATGQKDLVVAVAGLDKTYKINLAGHASTADNDDAADLAQFSNDAESAKSDRYYDQCWAWADFRYDSYAKQASAVATPAATIWGGVTSSIVNSGWAFRRAANRSPIRESVVPWSELGPLLTIEDVTPSAAAKRDWWNTTMSDYLSGCPRKLGSRS